MLKWSLIMTTSRKTPTPKHIDLMPGKNRFYRLQWRLMIIGCALVILDLFVLSFLSPHTSGYGSVGGLDGCLKYPDGTIYQGQLTISGAAGQTDAQGCFFFPSLQAGTHNLVVQVEGHFWQRTVRVVRGQATRLGWMTLEFR